MRFCASRRAGPDFRAVTGPPLYCCAEQAGGTLLLAAAEAASAVFSSTYLYAFYEKVWRRVFAWTLAEISRALLCWASSSAVAR